MAVRRLLQHSVRYTESTLGGHSGHAHRNRDNKSTALATVNVAVIAHERVRVVAGEFDAFKIVATGSFRGLSKGGPGILSGDVDQTYWYAPAARAVVKFVSRNPYRGTSTVELVEATLR